MKNLKSKYFFILILIVFILIIILINKQFKKREFGNNKTSQEIINDILNITSYEAKISVLIKSNKNENCYTIYQRYNGEQDNLQEVLEPSNIQGIKIEKKGNDLIIKNSKLDLISVFNNYEYIAENDLDLIEFIKEFKENNRNCEYEQNDNEIIMKAPSKSNKNKEKKLYIDIQTENPKKLEIKNNNKKLCIYIEYKEVKINR